MAKDKISKEVAGRIAKSVSNILWFNRMAKFPLEVFEKEIRQMAKSGLITMKEGQETLNALANTPWGRARIAQYLKKSGGIYLESK